MAQYKPIPYSGVKGQGRKLFAEQISAEGSDYSTIYTVPDNYFLLISDAWLSASHKGDGAAAYANARIFSENLSNPGSVAIPILSIKLQAQTAGHVCLSNSYGSSNFIVIEPKSLVVVGFIQSSGTHSCIGGFHGYLMHRNDYSALAELN